MSKVETETEYHNKQTSRFILNTLRPPSGPRLSSRSTDAPRLNAGDGSLDGPGGGAVAAKEYFSLFYF